MATTTVRIKPDTHRRLKDLASADNASLSDMLDRVVKEEERRRFWKAVNDSYERLRADPEAWAEWQAEVALWETTSADGLPEEPDDAW